MKTRPIHWLPAATLTFILAIALAATGAAGSKEVKLPRSHVEAVDFTNMTFTVAMNATSMTVRVTAETRFFLNEKPAISKDIEPGDHVRGTIRLAKEGTSEALRIHIEKPAPK
ncbi:MAG: hypothetical protein ABMA26_19040 [Limisphaerales bacterium]